MWIKIKCFLNNTSNRRRLKGRRVNGYLGTWMLKNLFIGCGFSCTD